MKKQELPFKKYSSIENHYNQRFIDSFKNIKDLYLDLDNEEFIVSQKYDGANIQLVFQPGEKTLVGKRSGYLSENADFFDIWSVLDEYKEDILDLESFSRFFSRSFIIYGELYGKGINNRIPYDKKHLVFFDCFSINHNEFFDQEFFINMIDYIFLLPSYSIIKGLDAALAIDVPENTEGFIIQPYNRVLRAKHGGRFILKKKHPNFDKSIPDEVRQKRENLNGLQELNNEFKKYINDTRVKDLFSKHGMIQDKKQLGEYIKLLLEDAKEDFIKYNSIISMSKKDLDYIFNVGSLGANLIKKYIN